MLMSRRATQQDGYPSRLNLGKSILGMQKSEMDGSDTNEYLNDRAFSRLQIEPKKVVEVEGGVPLACNCRGPRIEGPFF
jgi:hypothetical protein